MEKRHRTDAALDDALDALLAGDKQSLLKAIRIVENHPRAEELRHLLTSAIETREAIRATPSDQARVRHLRMIGVACREQERSRAVRKARDLRRMRGLVFRPLAIAGASLGLLIPGALALASTAQPGQALYGTKLTVEQVQLALTTSPEAEIELHLKFAERRMDEVERLERAGGDVGPAVNTAVSNLESHTAAVKNAVVAMGNDSPPSAALTTALERHRDGISHLAGQTGCDRSRSTAGCEGLRSALDTSVLALKQLRNEPPAGSTLAEGPDGQAGGSTSDKPNPDKGPGKTPQSPEAGSPSPTTPASGAAPSESASPSETASPSESPSEAPGTSGTGESPSPEPSPSPSPDPSASPSGGPEQEPSPSDEPTTTVSTESPGQTDPAPPAGDSTPNGGAIEPHSIG